MSFLQSGSSARDRRPHDEMTLLSSRRFNSPKDLQCNIWFLVRAARSVIWPQSGLSSHVLFHGCLLLLNPFPSLRRGPWSINSRAEPLHRYRKGGYHPITLRSSLNNGKYKVLHKLGWEVIRHSGLQEMTGCTSCNCWFYFQYKWTKLLTETRLMLLPRFRSLLKEWTTKTTESSVSWGNWHLYTPDPYTSYVCSMTSDWKAWTG